MKDLISIFAYCPDNHRKKILQELLEKIQVIRDKYEIIVVSHSPISDLSFDLIDYFHYDKSNKLLSDLDLRRKHWFQNKYFRVTSTFVHPSSTHLAIYSLLYYIFNFAKFKSFNKVHCLEYDINIENIDLITDVNSTLNEFDTVMFKDMSNNWIFGIYYAFTMNKIPKDYFIYDEEKILEQLRNSETKMTESITDKVLTPNGRTIKFEPQSKIDSTYILQKVDNHMNNELNWCVPVCDKNSDMLYFFVFNQEGEKHNIDVIVDGKHFNIKTKALNHWVKIKIGDINNIFNILVLVDGKIKKHIILNDDNKKMFKKDNLITYFE